MPRNIPDGNGPFHRFQEHISIFIHPGVHLHIFKFWSVFGELVVQIKCSRFVKGHKSGSGKWLGHGIDLNQGVPLHRNSLFTVRKTIGPKIGFLSLFVYQRRDTCYLSGGNKILKQGIKLGDTLRIDNESLVLFGLCFFASPGEN